MNYIKDFFKSICFCCIEREHDLFKQVKQNEDPSIPIPENNVIIEEIKVEEEGKDQVSTKN